MGWERDKVRMNMKADGTPYPAVAEKDLVTRLFESDAASVLTNEAARRIEELERELASERSVSDISKQFHDLVVVERNAALMTIERLKEQLVTEKGLADDLYALGIHWADYEALALVAYRNARNLRDEE